MVQIEDRTDRRNGITAAIAATVAPGLSKRDLKTYTKSWWRTPWPFGGFCLTPPGNQAFLNAEIEYSTHPFVEGADRLILSAGNLLRMSILMPCPYFVVDNARTPLIRVFDSDVSTLIFLYGDVDKYLNSLEYENESAKAQP